MNAEKNGRVLLVIDMQNDFIDGALGSPEAQAIVETVKEKIDDYADVPENRIVFTRDTHHNDDYMESNEGKHLPVKHCIEGEFGWKIAKGLVPDRALAQIEIVNKPSFGYLGWAEKDFGQSDIEIIGLCTDICVVSNALIIKAQYPENNVVVDARCCAGVTPQKHQEALGTMESCQVDVIGREVI